jgi:cystathionine beta-lyase family protein involved in aluminum resistance
MAAAIASPTLTRHQAQVAYSSMYSPMMTYSLPSCSFSDAELTQMQCRAVDTFRPTLGYDHSLPSAVAYGPSDLGGSTLNHMYAEQGMMKVESMFSHIRHGSPLGNIM